jgi:hypothetical protein
MNDDDLPDLLAWRVPPPPELDTRSLVLRALTPATQPARRPRLRWVVAALVVTNAVIAALLVIVLARPSARPTAVVVPAGDASTDLRVQQLLARLSADQAQLEGRLAELEETRALVKLLQAQVDLCEHAHTVKPPPTPVIPPTPVTPPGPTPLDTSCDEVSCVLTNYPGGCCDKYKKTPAVPPPPGILDALDRTAISNGVASVKAAVAACATTAPAKGTVKVHVRVGANGLVTNVEIDATPDAKLGACVATAMQRAVFVRTKQGGSFSYPFVF